MWRCPRCVTHCKDDQDACPTCQHAAYPVERTLLTTGILDAVMNSKHEKNKKMDTKHLSIAYRPVDWPFATDAVSKPIKRKE